ncbi:hypothetical protein BLNAU_22786 [Blattamonas nauphoetae]|uniref:Uncharacterized protein n=1 Tax=Blattamonas nauphoetae TaxID=2049346 RepID=A0ABQ9WW89_9EUKA|nr:hypothetical protein BLNAU_22786 [Blattamonas nauphoetae]
MFHNVSVDNGEGYTLIAIPSFTSHGTTVHQSFSQPHHFGSKTILTCPFYSHNSRRTPQQADPSTILRSVFPFNRAIHPSSSTPHDALPRPRCSLEMNHLSIIFLLTTFLLPTHSPSHFLSNFTILTPVTSTTNVSSRGNTNPVKIVLH